MSLPCLPVALQRVSPASFQGFVLGKMAGRNRKRCVSHKFDERLPSVASHTGQQYLCYAVNGLNKPVAVSATLTFATPQAAYANTLRSANFYIILNNYAICASAHGSSRPAGRIIQIMQKSAGSVPRPTSLSGVL